MASVRKVTVKRHNPVESICRKIRAIQEGEVISNPIRQIIKYQSNSFDSPQTHSKKDFEEVLKKMTATRIPMPDTNSSSSEKDDTFISSPQIVSPGTPLVSRFTSPENAIYSVILTGSEDISRLRAQCSQVCTSLPSQIRKEKFFLSKDLKSFCSENDFRTLTLDFDSNADQSSEVFTPRDSDVEKLSLNEEGWKLGTNDDKVNVTDSINGNCEGELVTSAFHACDIKLRGSVGVGKIIQYLRQTASRDSEDSGLEELWNRLDPERRDLHVDLGTFHDVIKEWMASCRNKREGMNSGLSSSIDNSVFEQWHSIKSVQMTDITDSASGSFESLRGDISKGNLKMSDLMTYVADLHFNKQKLEEENNMLKLALETLEEANRQLAEDCTELRSKINSAHQAIIRTNLLKEELEELKISMNASEEQKAMVTAQNKQLEKENRALILKIRTLQEENTKNIMDIDRLEKKIQEFSKIETAHQMQLHIYENTLLNKDASLQKKDLSIQELKSTIREYGTIIENLREDKHKLADELQCIQQELLVNGIRLNVSGQRNHIIPEEGESLHCELILAESAEHEEVSEVETLFGTCLQWVTNPEMTVKEKWENKLIEFKHIVEEKLSLCVLILNSLGNHRENLEKEFVKLIETLKRFRLEYFYFRKECLSRQKQLEAIKQVREHAADQEAVLTAKLQRVSQGLEEMEEQVEDGDRAAPSASVEAESSQHKLEEAVSEERNLQITNTELLSTCQTLEQKTRKLKTTIKSLRKNLIKGRPLGLLFQRCLDEEFSQSESLYCINIIQQPLQEQLGILRSEIFFLPLEVKRLDYEIYYVMPFNQLTLLDSPFRSGITTNSTVVKNQNTPDTPDLETCVLVHSLAGIPRLRLTSFSCVANRIPASSERPIYGEINNHTLNVAKGRKCPGPTGGPLPQTGLSSCFRMSNDPHMEKNGVEHLYSESLPQSREYSTPPPPGCISSVDSTVASSDSGSEILNMASGDLDSKLLCEKEKTTRSASTKIGIQGTSSAHENIPLQDSKSEDKIILKMESKEEAETIGEHRKECAAGDTALSTLPVTTVKSVNFRQSDNISANEKEVEAEFLRLSLGFKCDWFTLEKRVKLEERSRDLAEENLKKEITNCLKLLECLTPLCEDDNQAQEIIKKLEKSITFLSQCTSRVASRAEMLGAINQESRVSKAVEVMIQHVENLKRMYAKEHAELEELKQVLLQNERSFNPLEDEDDCQIKKRSSSLNSKPPSLRRVTIASLPRNIGNAGTMAGMENNDRFSRRSSSWRILGSKQSEHRPSLHRFISTYSWADAEDEKCDLKTKDDSEPPGEETVERTRKPSLSEKRNNPSKWDVSSVYDTMSSWATNLKSAVRKANKPLWISVSFIVLFAALMSFLTGRFFQKPVDAAPTQNGDSWMSLEHALWPFTRLQHNGPPPV